MKEGLEISRGGKLILNTIKDELFPCIKNLKDLIIKIQKCHIKFPLYSFELNKLEKEYLEVSEKFFTVSIKLQTPDILFKDLEEDPRYIVDYFQYKEAIGQTIVDGSKIIEIIDRTLDRKRQNIENNRALYISITAIVLSIIFS